MAGKRILLVGADPTSGKLTQDLLNKGNDVATADDVTGALDSITHTRPSAVFVHFRVGLRLRPSFMACRTITSSCRSSSWMRMTGAGRENSASLRSLPTPPGWREASARTWTPVEERCEEQKEARVTTESERLGYKKVASGSTVETLDGEHIGVISEIRGDLFKIKTPRFHRDYWLRVDSVRSATVGEKVVLNVPRAELDNIKIVDPQLQ